MDTGSRELVFLIRMWTAGTDAGDEQPWRGSIQEVNSGLRLYVTGSRDIADFIDARLSDKAVRRTGDGRSR